MKKLKARILYFVIALTIVLCSCSKAKTVPTADEIAVAMDVASEYYDNIKTLMYASSAFDEPDINETYETLLEDESSVSSNPMSIKLKYLEIEDETTGKLINFYDLPSEQQELLVDLMLDQEEKELLKKLIEVPELIPEFEAENKAISKVIEDNQLVKLEIGAFTKQTYNNITYATTGPAIKSNAEIAAIVIDEQIKKVDASILFNEIKEDIQVSVNKQVLPQRNVQTKGWTKDISTEKVRSAWSFHARRGDFVISLPRHGYLWAYVWLYEDFDFSVGHSSIINEQVNNSTSVDHNMTVECTLINGVERKNIAYWAMKHYIMGIQETTRKWVWKGWRSGYRTYTKRVSDPSKLADEAEKYLGVPYSSFYEFPVAKLFAPNSFTCTTLIWYCAKKAYGINVSNWYSSLISVNGLYSNSNTYVIAVVE